MVSATFGQRLKGLRTERQLSQRALADLLNLSHGTIGMYEAGLRQPDHDTLRKLADFFRTTTDFLLGQTDDPSGEGAIKLAHEQLGYWQGMVMNLQHEIDELSRRLETERQDRNQEDTGGLSRRLEELKNDLRHAMGEAHVAEYHVVLAQQEAERLRSRLKESPHVEELVYFLRGRNLSLEDAEAVKDLLEARRLRREREQQERERDQP